MASPRVIAQYMNIWQDLGAIRYGAACHTRLGWNSGLEWMKCPISIVFASLCSVHDYLTSTNISAIPKKISQFCYYFCALAISVLRSVDSSASRWCQLDLTLSSVKSLSSNSDLCCQVTESLYTIAIHENNVPTTVLRNTNTYEWKCSVIRKNKTSS